MNAQPVGYRARTLQPRSLALFFVLAFGLTWIKDILDIVLHMRMPAGIADPAVLYVLFIGIPGACGPTAAAFIVAAISEGREGVKALWQRFWNRSTGLKWLLAALLFYDLVRLAANLMARLLDGQAYLILVPPDPAWSNLPDLLTPFIINGMGEEFGWRGYVLPRFQARWSALASSLLLGAIWACWHLPFFFIPGASLYQRNFLEWAPWLILSSIVYTWLFNNTGGSILAACLFHATANYSMFILPTQASLWYFMTILAAAIALIVKVFGAQDLVRHKPQKAVEMEGVHVLSG